MSQLTFWLGGAWVIFFLFTVGGGIILTIRRHGLGLEAQRAGLKLFPPLVILHMLWLVAIARSASVTWESIVCIFSITLPIITFLYLMYYLMYYRLVRMHEIRRQEDIPGNEKKN